MPPVSHKNNQKRPKNRKNKINLVFDEEKRREFLTGFHKRKLQRKKAAQEKLEQELKSERKRLKLEAKESYKKLIVSHRPIPELENLFSEEYEDDEVKVKVVELSTNEIAKQNNWIGANQPCYETDEEVDENEVEEEAEEVPGMELKRKPAIKEKKEKPQFGSKKEIKKVLKKKATKNMQKSKVFQKKNRVERQKQRKQSIKQKKEEMKMEAKLSKRKGHRRVKKERQKY